MNKNQSKYWKLWADVGGTFTDCLISDPQGTFTRKKILSSGRLRGKLVKKSGERNYIINTDFGISSENVIIGYTIFIDDLSYSVVTFDIENRSLLLDKPIPAFKQSQDFEITAFEEAPVFALRIVSGTRLKQPLPPTQIRLGTTMGTNALLEKKGANVALIITKGFKDLVKIGDQRRSDLFQLAIPQRWLPYTDVYEVDERIDSKGEIISTINIDQLKELQRKLKASGPESLAISFLNSYKNSLHEFEVSLSFEKAGFQHLSVSSALSPKIKYLPRTMTALVNAYLAPVLQKFKDNMNDRLASDNFKVMTSSGSLAEASIFKAKDSLLSGPAAGVSGCAYLSRLMGLQKVLTIDMGGTSTDVSRYDGHIDFDDHLDIGDITIFNHALSIHTVAAGGGSICKYKDLVLQVGPESAGAVPGPASYGKNGPLTITDVNLLLGRIVMSNFTIPITKDQARKQLEIIKNHCEEDLSDESILTGFLEIANTKMAAAIHKISFEKGYNPSEYHLMAFGGAGGQHACGVAEKLGIKNIFIPYDGSLLSAYGLGKALISKENLMQILKPLDEVYDVLPGYFEKLEKAVMNELSREGFTNQEIEINRRILYLRFKGQETSLAVDFGDKDQLFADFKLKYENQYGHWIKNRTIEVEFIQLIGSNRHEQEPVKPDFENKYLPRSEDFQHVFLNDAWENIPVYKWETLRIGAEVPGPALLFSDFTTIVIERDWQFFMDGSGNGRMIFLGAIDSTEISGMPMAVKQELFSNRLTSIAENMGALLQRCAFSVNIKERLDFSCAILDKDAELVVNAPHIPVHLGSMGVCVRAVRDVISLGSAQVVITNHPSYGGSHLPDITLIAAAYDDDNQLIGYVTNRAHHAEIGGKSPGSMPADAINLEEEGVVIPPMYLVKDGIFQEEAISKLLTNAKYPTRSIEENLADLNAGVAAIQLGVNSLKQLAKEVPPSEIQSLNASIKENASNVLWNAILPLMNKSFQAKEYLDDGTLLNVCIHFTDGQLIFDFSGTSDQHTGNLNATPAILNGVIIYVLRILADRPLSLNEGLMKYVKLIVPEGSVINPLFFNEPENCPAVVGGNTETSQRLVDTVFKALKLSACSQGTMNNFLFGNESFGYYETIGGGSGAGKGFHGVDGVHQHMTNTGSTDPEILEHRYPVKALEWSINHGSGGIGKWNGGDGIRKIIQFNEPVVVTTLMQHRKQEPYGIEGGKPGSVGRQYIVRPDGEHKPVKGIDQVHLERGDKIVIETPGGGGYGHTEMS